ncbi:MAG: S1 family peptidase [Deltaproteobacteria bacterium]|nr:S1 family peptidase [Deltaproteobacteria bacterium]
MSVALTATACDSAIEPTDILDEVDEDLSVFHEEELDAQAEMTEPQDDEFRITYGVPDGNTHREVVWIPSLGCSGITLSERYILTAGHCLDNRLNYPANVRGSIGNIQVQYSPTGGLTSAPVTVYNGPASASIDPNFIFQEIFPCQYSEYDFGLIQLGGDASQFVRARWHQVPVEPNVVQHEVVGWGQHGAQAGSPSAAGILRMLGWMNSHGWDPNQGINLVGGSLTDPGDSGGGYFIKPGSWARILTGVHACLVHDPWNSGADGARVATHVPWIFGESAALGRPLSCHSSSLLGVPYLYGCSD